MIGLESANSSLLAPGTYTGTLRFSGENGAAETVTVHLTVTEQSPAPSKIYLPAIGR